MKQKYDFVFDPKILAQVARELGYMFSSPTYRMYILEKQDRYRFVLFSKKTSTRIESNLLSSGFFSNENYLRTELSRVLRFYIEKSNRR